MWYNYYTIEWGIIDMMFSKEMFFLGFFESIKNFFINIVDNITWTDLFVLLSGIIIGFILFSITYLIVVLNGIKKADKKHKQIIVNEDINKTDEVNKIIKDTKKLYHEESKDYIFNQKMEYLKDLSWQMMNDIAKIYYPESKYPISELSIDELIKLCYYITNRIDEIFQGKFFKLTRNFKISQLMYIIDKKKQFDDNKIIRTSKKLKVEKVYNVTKNILNIFNPAHWVRKLILGSTLDLGYKKIANIVIDIIGNETAKVYSKNIFNNDTEISMAIKDLENELDGE